jgi:hypothetical protein
MKIERPTYANDNVNYGLSGYPFRLLQWYTFRLLFTSLPLIILKYI